MNPDLPRRAPTAKPDQFNAMRALLEQETGIALPNDCTINTLVRDLLTALKTIVAVKDVQRREDADDSADDDDEVEEKLPIQFSTDSDADEARRIVDAQLSQYGGVGGCYQSRA
ncbi:MAG TPA: hypothetical protein VMV10_02175 [Pirellulales bacterium]|nr:hypothetical protein [Pirellulales bacterium]